MTTIIAMRVRHTTHDLYVILLAKVAAPRPFVQPKTRSTSSGQAATTTERRGTRKPSPRDRRREVRKQPGHWASRLGLGIEASYRAR